MGLQITKAPRYFLFANEKRWRCAQIDTPLSYPRHRGNRAPVCVCVCEKREREGGGVTDANTVRRREYVVKSQRGSERNHWEGTSLPRSDSSVWCNAFWAALCSNGFTLPSFSHTLELYFWRTFDCNVCVWVCDWNFGLQRKIPRTC